MTGRPRPSCPPPELVQAAHEGVLSGVLEARVSEHVQQCGICRALLAAIDNSAAIDLTVDEQDRILKRVRAQARVVPPVEARPWRWAAAAVIVLTAAGSLLVWQWRRPSAPPDASAALPVIQLDKPGMPPADQRIDGTAAPSARERAELLLALAPYRDNDYLQAGRSLEEFVTRYPQNAAGHFYRGVSDLFLDRNASGVTALELAENLAPQSDPWIAQRASWYLALAYQRTGQSELARSRLQAVCNQGGEFGLRACELQASTYQVTGTVTNAVTGEPIAGATIAEYTARFSDQAVLSRTSHSASTDASGRYVLPGMRAYARRGPGLRVTKQGFFTGFSRLPSTSDMRADYQLTPWSFIQLDDVVTGTLTAGAATCAGIAAPCRQFAVLVPRSGTLEASLAPPPPEPLDVWVETPEGDLHSPLMKAPRRVVVPVFAGAVYQITVVNYGDVPRSFELTMRVR